MSDHHTRRSEPNMYQTESITLSESGIPLVAKNERLLLRLFAAAEGKRRKGKITSLAQIERVLKTRRVESSLLSGYPKYAWPGCQVEVATEDAPFDREHGGWTIYENSWTLTVERTRTGWKLVSAKIQDRRADGRVDDARIVHKSLKMLERDASAASDALYLAERRSSEADAALAEREAEIAAAVAA